MKTERFCNQCFKRALQEEIYPKTMLFEENVFYRKISMLKWSCPYKLNQVTSRNNGMSLSGLFFKDPFRKACDKLDFVCQE